MGQSRHSKRSKAGAAKNKYHVVKVDNRLKWSKETSIRLNQFEAQELIDLESLDKIDKVKFYPKTNQADARQIVNK